MSRKKKNKPNGSIDEAVKVLAGFAPETPDEVVRDFFDKEFPESIERPCGVLSWCPYGPLVEQFPPVGSPPGNPHVEPVACGVFGHYCPVYYVAEPFADIDAIAENLCDECRAKLLDGNRALETGALQHSC